MLRKLVCTVLVIAAGNLPFSAQTIPAVHAITSKTIVATNASSTTSIAPPPISAPAPTTIPNPVPVASQEVVATPAPKLEEIKPVQAPTFTYAAVGTYTNSYDWGQCTWGVASMKANIPSDWGNAINWASAARSVGKIVNNTPVVGAVGVSFGGIFGHVVVVTALNPDGTIQITETNYDGYGDGLYRSRTADISEFIYIYI